MKRTGRILAIVFTLLFRAARAVPIPEKYAQTYRDPVMGVLEDLDNQIGANSEVWVRASISVCLVLLGGVFAGLTIGLMGQDEVYLQVTAETGEEEERRCAAKVSKLLAKGKHWVLVTLLLSNVVTNETLPIVSDRLSGGGWPAIVSSTAAIVVFGEIIPQSICVRYGLPLGAYFAPFVQSLMYAMYPLAVPIAKLLDWTLGEDHGTVYKKAGLKSLVTLHHHMGIERLNEDEVTIISAVSDSKDKPVSHIMTPIDDVFVSSSDTILDEQMVEKISLTGFNRIPIHFPDEPMNFCGMLLVRTLITYDPDDALPISAFALATLPETSPDTSCLNILNYFQEGKSHMVAVSTDPGAVSGAVGVVTLEDVIEELIGEEIVDESDVYVDVHRAIRRVKPAPMSKGRKRTENTPTNDHQHREAGSRDPKFTALRPLNKASDPKVTHNTKITIKRGPQPNQQHFGQRTDGTNVLIESHDNHGHSNNASSPADASHNASTNEVSNLAQDSTNPNHRSGMDGAEEHVTPSTTTSNSDSRSRGPGPHYLATSIVNDSNHTDSSSNNANRPLSEIAKSPGSIVTKVQGGDQLNVATTESGALHRNMLRHGATKLSRSPRSSFHDKSDSESEGNDDARATFSENVVRVNGMNKVVIAEISTSDDNDSDSESRSGKRK